MPRVSIAIPTYDGRELLDVVLPSVFAQDFPSEDVEVVVVDDGSTDGTLEHLARRWPQVRAVGQENAGITAAMNRCLAECSGEYVVLLNNDLELDPRFLRELVDALEAHPEAGSACGKMLDFTDRSVLDGAGDVVRWSSAAWRRGHGERDVGQYDTPEAVFSPCGGAAVYRREALEDVGVFDGDFVAYLEDIDWGFRAQLRGWTCRYVPSAVCFHMGSATTDRPEVSERFAALLRRNGILFLLKDYPARALVVHLPEILCHHLGWFVGSVREGLWRAHLTAWWGALRWAPAFWRKRAEIQRGRRVSVRYLDAIIGD